MKSNLFRRVSALTLALGLGLSLTACGDKSTGGLSVDEAKAYVEGLMKETYLGEFDENYMELVGITEDEAERTYQNCLEVETALFIDMYGIEFPTDEMVQKLQDMYAEIYSHAKFEVVSAAAQDDGSFSVKVTVEPINIVQLADAGWDAAMEPFFEQYTADVQNAMTDEEYEAMDRVWAEMIYDLYQSKMPEIGNMDARSISVQLEKDEDGYYCISDDDFSRLDQLIIDYTDNTSSAV